VVLRDGEVRQIGTPETLYARPADPDVAEFMGFRNIVHTAATAAGNLVRVGIGAAALDGTPVGGMVDGPAVVAIRPDDLVPHGQGEILATVQSAEYRGRDFYGLATTPEGIDLYFRSDDRVQAGEALRLGADPASVLVYAEAA